MNEAALRAAIAEVFAASTALTGLTGKAQPVVRYGDKGMNDRPVISYYVPDSEIRRGTKDGLRLWARFDVWVDGNSTGLEEAIADAVEAEFTNANLSSTALTSPVDAAPYLRARRELPELDEGRRRLMIEFQVWLNRS